MNILHETFNRTQLNKQLYKHLCETDNFRRIIDSTINYNTYNPLDENRNEFVQSLYDIITTFKYGDQSFDDNLEIAISNCNFNANIRYIKLQVLAGKTAVTSFHLSLDNYPRLKTILHDLQYHTSSNISCILYYSSQTNLDAFPVISNYNNTYWKLNNVPLGLDSHRTLQRQLFNAGYYKNNYLFGYGVDSQGNVKLLISYITEANRVFTLNIGSSIYLSFHASLPSFLLHNSNCMNMYQFHKKEMDTSGIDGFIQSLISKETIKDYISSIIEYNNKIFSLESRFIEEKNSIFCQNNLKFIPGFKQIDITNHPLSILRNPVNREEMCYYITIDKLNNLFIIDLFLSNLINKNKTTVNINIGDVVMLVKPDKNCISAEIKKPYTVINIIKLPTISSKYKNRLVVLSDEKGNEFLVKYSVLRIIKKAKNDTIVEEKKTSRNTKKTIEENKSVFTPSESSSTESIPGVKNEPFNYVWSHYSAFGIDFGTSGEAERKKDSGNKYSTRYKDISQQTFNEKEL